MKDKRDKKTAKYLIPDSAGRSKAEPKETALTSVERALFGFYTGRDENPYVSLKYIDTEHQCFSDWDQSELKLFSGFLKKLAQTPWPEILRSGGTAGNKTGLGCTHHKNRQLLLNSAVLQKISEDINFIELRVSQRARVHGFRLASAFFLVWLDRDHEIYRD